MGPRVVRLVALGALGAVAGVEAVHRRAARRDAAPDDVAGSAPPGAPAVVVLGYPTRADGRPHPVQRWRVHVAVRTARRHGADLVVFSGGAVKNAHVEAETMASLARRAGLATEIACETQARSTRENVLLAHGLVAGRARVLLVSDPLHVARARRLWLAAWPEDAGRVFGGDTYRPLERWPLKAGSAAFELALARRHRRAAP